MTFRKTRIIGNYGVKRAPCVVKDQKIQMKKDDAKPLHLERFIFYYKTQYGRDKSAKKYIKSLVNSKSDTEIEVGTKYNRYSESEKDGIVFLRITANVKNSIRLMQKFEGNGMFMGSGELIPPKPKDKTNYYTQHKKLIKNIHKEISKLTIPEIEKFEKNYKLRDKLIKRLKRKTIYPLSTIDSWLVDEVYRKNKESSKR